MRQVIGQLLDWMFWNVDIIISILFGGTWGLQKLIDLVNKFFCTKIHVIN